MSLKSKQKVHTPLPGPHLLVCLRIVGEGPNTNWCKKRRCKTSPAELEIQLKCQLTMDL